MRAATTGAATPEGLRLLEASSPATVLGRITAPTLLVQGEADSLFPLSEGDANARGIAANGTPVKVVWYGGGHDGGLDETDRLRELVRDWFGHYLKKDGSPADTRFEVSVPAATISSADSNPAPQVRVRGDVPGMAGSPPVQRRAIALRDAVGSRIGGPGQLVVAPAGGVPAAVTSLPGLGSALGALERRRRVRSAGVRAPAARPPRARAAASGSRRCPTRSPSSSRPPSRKRSGSSALRRSACTSRSRTRSPAATTPPCSPSCTTSLPAARPPCPSSSSPRCG